MATLEATRACYPINLLRFRFDFSHRVVKPSRRPIGQLTSLDVATYGFAHLVTRCPRLGKTSRPKAEHLRRVRPRPAQSRQHKQLPEIILYLRVANLLGADLFDPRNRMCNVSNRSRLIPTLDHRSPLPLFLLHGFAR